MKKNHSNSTYFTIVIPALNEEKFLPPLLDDLVNQTFKNFKVVLVDGQSDDLTITKAKEYQGKLDLEVISSKQRNVGFQRNLGGKKATSPWLLFIDADTRFPHYFLQGIKYHLEKSKQIDFFTCLFDIDAYSINFKPLISLMNISLQVSSYIQPFSYGSMIGVKRKIFENHRFDPSIHYCEDYLYTRSLDKAGYKFACFKDPNYQISLRRFEKDGFSAIVTSMVNSQIQLLTTGTIQKQKSYPMLGGSYYKANSNKLNRKLILKAKKSLKKILNKYEKMGSNS
ncbi:MAG: glycosyltransferase family 2 protein [Patescibacteria group bacterium]|nr:glycosyltransferase family 2 protein [Patescibacteria group bacterium]